ncbi:MAG: YdcF family protein [Cyanobacteriota bacterium]
MLALLLTPALILPLLALVGLGLARLCRLARGQSALLTILLPLVASLLFSSMATEGLSRWLQEQMPPSAPTPAISPVAVLVGRGPAIALASTSAVVLPLRNGQARAVYISGDDSATAEQLLRKGIPSQRIAGDSCARTTWDNATLTAVWLRKHHPGAPVLLITDPWQLPRATRAFQRQGLKVSPMAVEPVLSPAERNRLALRETAATLLYRLQGRS